MRLTVIGRNPQDANIVLNSQYISNYHAEIIQLDNGDIFLVDKSTNGTYLNGTKLTPGKEVAIRRGDSILFADVPLDWSLIDEIRIPKDVKQIMSIGSHYMNTINVQGPNVSRFHATIRKMADGKWYICDHSKNGTTVNGIRIQKDRYVLLKKGLRPSESKWWGKIGTVIIYALLLLFLISDIVPNVIPEWVLISTMCATAVSILYSFYSYFNIYLQIRAGKYDIAAESHNKE